MISVLNMIALYLLCYGTPFSLGEAIPQGHTPVQFYMKVNVLTIKKPYTHNIWL